ncbi:hypothetical protein ACE6ED_13775 [Paenibacillus sp. CN-4]|uniref:hypothetical protein n=1 Tax=Paenibacillus nanchangensis TaxID=3348343 RepID=UPI00397802BA
MSLTEEINALADLIRTAVPGAAVYLFQEPALLAKGDFVIQLKQENRSLESRSHTMVQRQYTITLFGEQMQDAVLTMEQVSLHAMNSAPAAGSPSVPPSFASFMYEPAGRTENGLEKCAATVQTEAREALAAVTYEKIKKMSIRTTLN